MIRIAYMKFLLGLVVFFGVGFFTQGQNLPNSFKLGEYLEVMRGDSLKVYFGCGGSVTEAGRADYYRVGRIDKENINFAGSVKDFYINGQLAFEGQVLNNDLNGKATFYHKNGRISETGFYKDHNRAGVWKYFYPNGKLEKVINFINRQPLVVTYLDSNSVAQVINGNGLYVGTFSANHGCTPYRITGPLKDGKMNGEWTMYNTHFSFGKSDGKEIFEDGKFIRGFSEQRRHIPNDYSNYSDYPRIKMVGLYAAETLHMHGSDFSPSLKNSKGQPIKTVVSADLVYNNRRLEYGFFPDLQAKLQAALPQITRNQWLVVGLKIEKSNDVSEIQVFSSIDDVGLEGSLHTILKGMNLWRSGRVNNARFGYHHYFTILIQDNQVVIPKLAIHQARENDKIILRQQAR